MNEQRRMLARAQARFDQLLLLRRVMIPMAGACPEDPEEEAARHRVTRMRYLTKYGEGSFMLGDTGVYQRHRLKEYSRVH